MIRVNQLNEPQITKRGSVLILIQPQVGNFNKKKPVAYNFTLTPYLTQIWKGMADKVALLAASTRLNNCSSIINFKKILDDDLKIECQVPSEEDVKNIKTIQDFKIPNKNYGTFYSRGSYFSSFS